MAKSMVKPAAKSDKFLAHLSKIMEEVDGAAISDAFEAEPEATGAYWHPEDGTYDAVIRTDGVDPDSLITVREREDKEPSVTFHLPVEMVSNPDYPETVGATWRISFNLNVMEDKKTGESRVYSAGDLKHLHNLLFGEVENNLQLLLAKLVKDGDGLVVTIKQETKKDKRTGELSKYPNYRFVELVQAD